MDTPPDATPQRYRYTLLLAVLVAAVVTQSARSSGPLADTGLNLVATILAVAIFVVIFRNTRERTVMAAVLAIMVLIGWTRDWLPLGSARAVTIVFQGLTAVYLWCAVAAILRDLYRGHAPGVQNILGAICGYLIAGAAWSCVNIVAYMLALSSFAIAPAVSDLVGDWHGRIALFSYYSFTQLLTIGYADVTPLRAPATTLSLIAAMFGVFYTAVVVSQLVAVAQRR